MYLARLLKINRAVRVSPTPHLSLTAGLPKSPTDLPHLGDLRSVVSARSGDLRRARWHQSKFFGRGAFIVTHLNKRAKNVVKFYNGRGNAER